MVGMCICENMISNQSIKNTFQTLSELDSIMHKTQQGTSDAKALRLNKCVKETR